MEPLAAGFLGVQALENESDSQKLQQWYALPSCLSFVFLFDGYFPASSHFC
jgi:hypothetical protein